MSEPSADAKRAAEKWGSKHGGQLSCGWQHVFARGYDAATTKLQRIADDSIVENVRQMNEIAKLRAENERLHQACEAMLAADEYTWEQAAKLGMTALSSREGGAQQQETKRKDNKHEYTRHR